jgi:cell division protein ZapA
MAEVMVRVNGRAYPVGCEDGQEQHVAQLAALFDQHVSLVSREVGQLGETRLFLLGALMLADEMADLRARLEAAEAELKTAKAQGRAAEDQVVAILEAAAKKIEQIAAKAA